MQDRHLLGAARINSGAIVKRLVTFLTVQQYAALRRKQQKTGVPVSTQIRMAVQEALKRKK